MKDSGGQWPKLTQIKISYERQCVGVLRSCLICAFCWCKIYGLNKNKLGKIYKDIKNNCSSLTDIIKNESFQGAGKTSMIKAEKKKDACASLFLNYVRENVQYVPNSVKQVLGKFTWSDVFEDFLAYVKGAIAISHS